ncbi:DEAD/DEAH box helicase family protein [Shewanella sp. GXUN23E]|uniref:DEAD/DEAH box helicase family protein n=1 Tax=Shewanella sp. GXUN23E TaxID=3422498 RepID=UPI003D7D204E
MQGVTNTRLYHGPILTTGGHKDPLLPKLIKAINHATEIDISVSFIQPSGLNLLFNPILDAIKSGTRVRILTSDYLSITSPVALQRLMLLMERGAQCRIFVCEEQHSFHMKSYIFVRRLEGEIAEGCAWVGSNNISKPALQESHEWTLRHDYQAPETSRAAKAFLHIKEQFEAIFTHDATQLLSHDWISKYRQHYEQQKSATRPVLAIVADQDDEQEELPTPNAVQEEALKALAQSRQQGFKRGLVVLATGMGKTWLAAFDAKQLEAKRVLFVAHREEILLQAEATFTKLLPESRSGLYNCENKQHDADFLFASIATIGKQQHLEGFAPDHFDYIVVDEFHHASAPTYKALLAYFEPRFLLGLTATPERSDQADILSLCDNNLVFERNLVHGIDAGILVPFDYFGIYDKYVDYQEIPWRNGKFDPSALDNALATKRRAAHVLKHWREKKLSRTLAFCVSKSHADYMASSFRREGLKAISVYSDSQVRRNEALDRLNKGEVDIIFSVDLFNEGTDLPAIDTVLMIRPTESKILFLQQLGRGLRQSPVSGKSKLVVLDFIGNHQSFLNRPATLLGVTQSTKIIENLDAPSLAAGCHVNFDPELLAFWQTLAKKYRASAQEDYDDLKSLLGHRPTAAEFYRNGYDLGKARKQHTSWFNLVADKEKGEKEAEGISLILEKHHAFFLNGIETTAMTKCFKPILLEALLELNGFKHPPTLEALAERSHRVLSRRPDLFAAELPAKQANLQATDKAWLAYWKGNPIKAFTTSNKSSAPWFSVEQNRFVATFDVDTDDIGQFHQMVQELVDLRLSEYIQRIEDRNCVQATDNTEPTQLAEVVDLRAANTPAPSGIQLPFYPDLKIACGHFKTGTQDKTSTVTVADGFGKLDPARHFIAPASGNSMNGGKNAIQDGDLLLLEWVTPNSAGSISNLTMAIEIQDNAGDNQYLLRNVQKLPDGNYQLNAQNTDYPPMLANEQMRTLARLKAVLSDSDIDADTLS